MKWKETKLETNKKILWFSFGSLHYAVVSSLREDQDRRCHAGTEDMGQARLDLQALRSPHVFAGVAEYCCFVLQLPVLSSSANPD